MGRKRKGNQQQDGDGEGTKQQGGRQHQEHEEEPVIRLLALHGSLVAVAVGTSLRVLDTK